MKVLTFSPYSYIWPHSLPEAIFSKLVDQEDAQIHYVSCGGVLNDFCVPMNSAGLRLDSSEERKNAICIKCKMCARDLASWGNFSHSSLSQYISSSEVARIEKQIENFDPQLVFDYKIDDFPIGLILSYDLLVRNKMSSKIIEPRMIPEALLQLKQALMLYSCVFNLFNKIKPDRIIVFNSYYLANSIAVALAEKFNIPVYSLHSGMHASDDMYKYLIVGKNHSYRWIKDILRYWPERSKTPINKEESNIITKHISGTLNGTSFITYSNKSSSTVNIRNFYSIPSNSKIILMTLSSSDELFAFLVRQGIDQLPNVAFSSQDEWIQEVIKYVACRKDIFLIIRPHPREFPNKRETKISPSVRILQNLFSNLPANVAVNWPDQNLSVYDLMDEVDLVLNGWSSVGKEIAFFGIPVLTHAPEILYYPEDLCYSARNNEEYFAKLEVALKTGWSASQIVKGFRWYAMETKNALFDISSMYQGRKPWRTNRYFLKLSSIASKIGINIDSILDLPRKFPKFESKKDPYFLIKNNLNVFLDLIENDLNRRTQSSIEEESKLIKDSLNKILKIKYSNKQYDKSKLQRNLEAFCKD